MIKKFLTNASWILIGRVVQLGLGFVMAMMITRYLGPTEFGRNTYVYSYIQLFLPVCALGMNDILVKTLLDNKTESDQIMGTVIVLRLLVSFVCMACSVALVSILNDGVLYRQIAMLQCLTLAFYSFDSLIYFFQANLLSKKVGISLALAYSISAVYKTLCIIFKKGILWFAFVNSMDYIALAAVLLYTYYKNGYKLVFSSAWVKPLLKRSSYYIIAGILVVIYGKVTDIFLLGKLVDNTNVGYYGSAITLCNAWPFVLTAIIDAANPMIIDLYDKDRELFRRRVKQLYCAVFYVAIAAALAILVVGDLVVYIVYGKDYMPAAIPLKIYSFSTAFAYLGVARVAWMQCENKTRYETLIALFGAVVNVSLNYILIKQFGIKGAAIAAVLTQFLTNFVFLLLMKETRENAKLIWEAILFRGVLNKKENPDV